MTENTDSTKMGKVESVSVKNTSEETMENMTSKTATILLDKLKEFRQSYNRTHGQVCEFFEQAHVIEKLYDRPPGSMTATPKRVAETDADKDEVESKDDEEDCCNEHKTGTIKKKLNGWRTVMREVVYDNPGLMKHVLDEIRKLKTELAFQHNNILELSHQLENHQGVNRKKDVFIAKLLEQSKLIRLDLEAASDSPEEVQELLERAVSAQSHENNHPLDLNPDPSTLQFGSMKPNLDMKALIESSGPFTLFPAMGNDQVYGNVLRDLKQDPKDLQSSDMKVLFDPQNIVKLDAQQQPKQSLVQTKFSTTTKQQNSSSSSSSFLIKDPSSIELKKPLETTPAPPPSPSSRIELALDHKLDPAIEPSIDKIQSVNKEGKALETIKADPKSPLVVDQSSQDAFHHHEGGRSEGRGRGRGRNGVDIRRIPLMGIIGQTLCAYMLSKVLRRKTSK